MVGDDGQKNLHARVRNPEPEPKRGCKGCLVGLVFFVSLLFLGPGLWLLVIGVPSGVFGVRIWTPLLLIGIGLLLGALGDHFSRKLAHGNLADHVPSNSPRTDDSPDEW